ncbi:MAG: hypothetical protein AAFU61_15140, partial [Pseudomonadota bacterium]
AALPRVRALRGGLSRRLGAPAPYDEWRTAILFQEWHDAGRLAPFWDWAHGRTAQYEINHPRVVPEWRWTPCHKLLVEADDLRRWGLATS